MYRERMDVNVREERTIIVDLVPVEKGPGGKLRLVDDEVPRLAADLDE